MWKINNINIIAYKLNLKGKERKYSRIDGWLPYFENYAMECEYELGENEYRTKLTTIPQNSRYIKSEEILYEIRKIQQDAVLQESIKSNLTREIGIQDTTEFLQTKDGRKQFWNELENVRYFYNFFKNRKNVFEK